jgi:hypothetical protein
MNKKDMEKEGNAIAQDLSQRLQQQELISLVHKNYICHICHLDNE